MPILEWLNKNEAIKGADKASYRLLKANTELSYGEQTENMLIKGDNLEALKALLPYYKGQVKCIYIDPPYNTGNAFEHYDDNLEHSLWLSLMYPRLELLRELLAEDGSIWIQIDDDEMSYLKVMCDEIFGRKNFITSLSVKMSHLSGVKMSHIEKKIPKIKEHILLYSKNKSYFRLKPAFEAVKWEESLSRYTQFITNKNKTINEGSVALTKKVA